MKNILLGLIIGISLVLQSCNQRDVPFHVDERFIYVDYAKDAEHLFSYTFLGNKSDEAIVSVPLRYSGYVLTEDVTYSVKISYPDAATALKVGDEYELPSTLTFGKGIFADTLHIKVKKTPRMKTTLLSMKIELLTNEHFQATQRGYLDALVNVSDMVSQPDWWTQKIIDDFLSTYSDKKYRLFVEEIFSGDFGALEGYEKRYYAVMFKDYIEENNILEDDGSPMTVSVTQ